MINYKLIADAIKHYDSKGFTYIEVPWLVTENIDNITRPDDVGPLRIDSKDKNLIASGEQGFLYLMVKGFLPDGKYQTVTPCFRDEGYDLIHTKFFMKNELIIINGNEQDVIRLAEMCHDYFFNIVPNPEYLYTYKTDDSYDIYYEGVEIGSYGIRRHQHLKWVYGTGLAEPRLSNLIKIQDVISFEEN